MSERRRSRKPAFAVLAVTGLLAAAGVAYGDGMGRGMGALQGALLGDIVGGAEGAAVGAAIGAFVGAERKTSRDQAYLDQRQAEIDARHERWEAEQREWEREAAERERSSSSSAVDFVLLMDVQDELMRLGYDIGVPGRETDWLTGSITAFQESQGLVPDGEISPDLLGILRSAP